MPRPGTVAILFVLAFPLLIPKQTPAAVPECPYQAVVEEDEAFARCGPGKNFYPTSKLRRGQHVTVRRHDPGGWFMIEPPAGSFSLIRADNVLQHGNVGTIKQMEQGQASVRVGSEIDPTLDSIYQRTLSSGEKVTILGEVVVPRKSDRVLMVKIQPPKGEFRWIDGKSLAPLDGPGIDKNGPVAVGPQPAANPLAQHSPTDGGDPPATPGGSPAGSPSVAATVPVPMYDPKKSNGSPLSAGSASTGQAIVDPAGRLDQIDLQFRDLVRSEPPTWNLEQIEQSYRELGQQTQIASIRSQLEMRYTAIAHYKQVKAQYDDYFRLVSQTTRKDAELAAIQNSYAPQSGHPPLGTQPLIRQPLPTLAVTGPQQSLSRGPSFELPVQQGPTPPRPRPVPDRPPMPTNANKNLPPDPSVLQTPVSTQSGPNPMVTAPSSSPRGPAPQVSPTMTSPAQGWPMPARAAGPNPVTTPSPQLAAPRQIRPQTGPQLDGAGIIQRAASTSGGLRHVLLAPNGRILAYLYPDRGVNLDAYVGRAMGVVGPRSFRPELRADVIIVRGVMPVRLTP